MMLQRTWGTRYRVDSSPGPDSDDGNVVAARHLREWVLRRRRLDEESKIKVASLSAGHGSWHSSSRLGLGQQPQAQRLICRCCQVPSCSPYLGYNAEHLSSFAVHDRMLIQPLHVVGNDVRSSVDGQALDA